MRQIDESFSQLPSFAGFWKFTLTRFARARSLETDPLSQTKAVGGPRGQEVPVLAGSTWCICGLGVDPFLETSISLCGAACLSNPRASVHKWPATAYIKRYGAFDTNLLSPRNGYWYGSRVKIQRTKRFWNWSTTRRYTENPYGPIFSVLLNHRCCNARDSLAPENYPGREVLKSCSGDATSDISTCSCVCV